MQLAVCTFLNRTLDLSYDHIYTSCLVPFQNCTKRAVNYLSAKPCRVTMIYIHCTDPGQEQCTLLQYD